jgi:hypothetical protein
LEKTGSDSQHEKPASHSGSIHGSRPQEHDTPTEGDVMLKNQTADIEQKQHG